MLLNAFRKLIITISLLAIILGCCSCKKEDVCENKICIECGAKATRYASGARPSFNSNEKCLEEIGSGVYRIFYCEKCFESVPKAQLQ